MAIDQIEKERWQNRPSAVSIVYVFVYISIVFNAIDIGNWLSEYGKHLQRHIQDAFHSSNDTYVFRNNTHKCPATHNGELIVHWNWYLSFDTSHDLLSEQCRAKISI